MRKPKHVRIIEIKVYDIILTDLRQNNKITGLTNLLSFKDGQGEGSKKKIDAMIP